MLAPNARLRARVSALAGASAETPIVPAEASADAPTLEPPTAPPSLAQEPILRRSARYAWALLLARIYEVFPLLCPKCGSEMRIIAFITDTVAVHEILAHLGESTSPPRLMPARGPPLWEVADAGQDDYDPQAQRAPDYQFDQRVAW